MAALHDKYRLEARLGGGGMAEVFVAATVGAEGFSRRVAIKRVLPGFSDNPQFARMFVDEAKISSRLQHPNIVSVLDFDRDSEGRLYLVMELVDGRDLDALASSGPLPFPVVIFVISEVLRGLGHAHDLPVLDTAMSGSHTVRSMRGIVHRDVSPHNVLLSWEGAVKVSDFGIAKARTADNATASVLIKGKPAYMSPEQANGEQLDGRSDLFAVGVMLWEMLCGRRLFVGDDTRATLAAVLFAQIPRPRSIRPDVPKDLERVAMRLLERDLTARYPTAEAAIADLLACSAAPRDGREQLKRALAERFPSAAPIRHSVLRAGGGHRSTPAHAPVHASHAGSHAHPTVFDAAAMTPWPGGANASSMPSLGAMRAAPTATLRPPPAMARGGFRRHWPIVLVATMLATVVVIAVVLSAGRTNDSKQGPATGLAGERQPPTPATHDAATAAALDPDRLSPPAPDAAAPAAAVPRDSTSTVPPAVEPARPPAPDATQPVSPRDTARWTDKARDRAQPPRPRVDKVGKLVITAFPALTVYIDGKRLHDTPLSTSLPVGRHRVRLVNIDTGHDESITVTIREDRPVEIHRE